MIKFESSGDFKKTDAFFAKMIKGDIYKSLHRYGREGVAALSKATPVDSSLTANSWGYEIKRSRTSTEIIWTNTHVESGVPIVILLQYGHGTRNGGYVQGRNFINPALKPVFDKIADGVWKEVVSA